MLSFSVSQLSSNLNFKEGIIQKNSTLKKGKYLGGGRGGEEGRG